MGCSSSKPETSSHNESGPRPVSVPLAERRKKSKDSIHNSFLTQLYPTDGSHLETDVDIIALHGLDTNSEKTWVFQYQNAPTKRPVNWLKDSHMLSQKFPKARILTCDWPTKLFRDMTFAERNFEELARDMFDSINNRPLRTDREGNRVERPIMFIASCIGGVILMKMLVMASGQSHPVAKATRGIVFLATPFSGTSYKDVAQWIMSIADAGNELFLKKELSNMMKYLVPSEDLNYLRERFTAYILENGLRDSISIFYETKPSSLPRKAIPAIPDYWAQLQPVVDGSSARLDIVERRHAFDRPHIKMNKFSGDDDDYDYRRVVEHIGDILSKIHHEQPMQQADSWIRTNRYRPQQLRIERLSGELLSMQSCYINLAIVEKFGENRDQAAALPFSLLARQKVEISESQLNINLEALFNERKGRDGRTIITNRILIRGRAGMGKTTLCKKILHEFYRGSWKEWSRRFDRVLWIPLRNLNRQERKIPGYNFRFLFEHEFFHSADPKLGLASELSNAVMKGNERTLFLLDGLDEVNHFLGGGNEMSEFLNTLFDQPNVIFTSRPSARAPPKLDLELETIGFYPEQVGAYIDADAKLGPKAEEVKLFLRKHSLIKSLVQIPILLDALCYAWEDISRDPPQNMTQIYQIIEEKLWRKDVPRIYKGDLSQQLQHEEIKEHTKAERHLIGWLAFAGLQKNIVDFTPAHNHHIQKQWKRIKQSTNSRSSSALADILASLSFLRAPEQRSSDQLPSYHFLHLTFQEYFAAQYFVRQCKGRSPLNYLNLETGKVEEIQPIEFLQRNKYHPNYEIVWRFVAGLLDSKKGKEKETEDFFRNLETPPFDLLGPTHQRLIMNCLSEVQSDSFSFRTSFENNLSRWLVFQCKLLLPHHKERRRQNFKQVITLASEIEFPEGALAKVLQENSHSEDIQTIIFASLKKRVQITVGIIELAISWLAKSRSENLTVSILALLSRIQDLPEKGLVAIFSLLEKRDRKVLPSAIDSLQNKILSDDFMLKKIKEAELSHQENKVEWPILKVIGNRSIPVDIWDQLVGMLGSRTPNVRANAEKILSYHREKLPTRVAEQIWSKFTTVMDRDIKKSCLIALTGLSELSPPQIQYLSSICQQHNESAIRIPALKLLYSLPNPPDEVLSNDLKLTERSRSSTPLIFYEPNETESSVWCKHELSRQTQANLIECLSSGNRQVRRTVMRQICQRTTLEKSILDAVVIRLDADLHDWILKGDHIHILHRLVRLPEGTQIVIKVLDWLDANELPEESKVSALAVFKNRNNLPKEILNRIAAYVPPFTDGRARNVKTVTAAMNALAVQSNLTEPIFKKIKPYITCADSNLANAAMQAVVKYSSSNSSSTPSALNDIAAQLKHRDQTKNGELVRQSAIQALGQRSDLPEDIVGELVKRLADPKESPDVKMQAARALEKQRHLSTKILREIAEAYTPETQNIWAFEWLADVMVRREGFHWQFLLNGPRSRLLSPLLLRSFKRPLCWYVKDGISYFEEGNGPESENLPNGLYISKINKDLDSARRSIQAPPTAILSSSGIV